MAHPFDTGYGAPRMPFKPMTLVVLLPLLAGAGAGVQAASLTDFDLAALSLDRPGAFATTAMPASGNFFVVPDTAPASTEAETPAQVPVSQLRRVLNDFSLTLRGIRYRRGGSNPKTGFDCSGFVRYVFQHTIGAVLPGNSASQYRSGTSVARGEMKTGDLVFFRIHGKRISHVGIYIGDNRFIHSPRTGKSVSVSNLDEAYWSRRFAGARRPDVLG